MMEIFHYLSEQDKEVAKVISLGIQPYGIELDRPVLTSRSGPPRQERGNEELGGSHV